MAFTTFTKFVDDLHDLQVTGVKTYVSEPPVQITTALLPLKFVSLPDGGEDVITMTGGTGLTQAVCEFIVILSPILTNTNPANYAASIAMMDNVNNALKTAVLDIGIDSWSLKMDNQLVNQTGYWAIFASITASG